MKESKNGPWVLGIDTSNYTTSVAAVDLEGNFLDQKRKLLEVPLGERGLRQSEALFAHLKIIDSLLADLDKPTSKLVALSVSERPRAKEDSYMPVFLVGLQFGRVLSQMMQIPLFLFSHQEGHLESAVYSGKFKPERPFLSLHLSGGTTELLLVEKTGAHYKEEIIAHTQDLSAGQFVDRVGVALGLKFPAGPALESLALNSQNILVIPSFFKEGKASFSGAETAALRHIRQGVNYSDVARATENCVAKTIEKMLIWGMKESKIKEVLLMGGVMANSHIRSCLEKRLTHPAVGAKLKFASPALSSDNAVGIARLGAEAYRINSGEYFRQI